MTQTIVEKKMKLIVKPLIAVTSACLMLSALAVTADEKSNQYKVQYLRDCNVVEEVALNPAQVRAYQDLQKASKKMSLIDKPHDFQNNKINQLSHEISKLSAEVHKEDNNRIVINKAVLKEQNKLVKELEQIVEEMQPHFSALETQGEVVSQKADIFEKSIESLNANFSYDHIRIITPENQYKRHQCYSAS